MAEWAVGAAVIFMVVAAVLGGFMLVGLRAHYRHHDLADSVERLQSDLVKAELLAEDRLTALNDALYRAELMAEDRRPSEWPEYVPPPPRHDGVEKTADGAIRNTY